MKIFSYLTGHVCEMGVLHRLNRSKLIEFSARNVIQFSCSSCFQRFTMLLVGNVCIGLGHGFLFEQLRRLNLVDRFAGPNG